MKIKLTVISLILFVITSCSTRNASTDDQPAEIDSLLTVYKKDVQTNPNNTIEQIRIKQISVADSVDYHKLSTVLAIGYFMNNKIDSAVRINKEVIRFCKTQNTKNPDVAGLIATAYNDIGVFFQITGQQDSAIIYLEKAANAVNISDEKNKLLDIYVNLADNYNQKSDYPVAADYYRKALFVADSLEIKDDISFVYAGIARVYTDLKNYQEADYYFNKVENVFDSLPDYDKYFFSNSRGNYYYSKHDYEKALPWFLKANSIAGLISQGSYVATTEGNLGELYLLLNRPDSAKYYLDKAATYFWSDESSPAAKFYLEGLYASYYLQMNDLHKAQMYLSRPYDKSLVNPLYIYYNNKRLEDLYARRGDYKKAYDLSRITKTFDDSVRNVVVQNNIAEIDSRYRQDTIILKRDIQLAHKEQELLKVERMNILIALLFIITILATFIIAIYWRKKKEIQQMRQISVFTRLRMESVRNRMSPHFVFNALNAMIPALQGHEELSRPVHLLIKSIRDSLMASEKMAITLEEEIEIVKNYIELRTSINPSQTPLVAWNIAPDTDIYAKIPSMIIQIPMENAVKYTFDPEESNNMITVDIYSKDTMLYISIDDNGKGFDPAVYSHSDKGTGQGLKILFSTIELLNSKNKETLNFNIQNKKSLSPGSKGTRVTIKIPIDYKYEL